MRIRLLAILILSVLCAGCAPAPSASENSKIKEQPPLTVESKPQWIAERKDIPEIPGIFTRVPYTTKNKEASKIITGQKKKSGQSSTGKRRAKSGISALAKLRHKYPSIFRIRGSSLSRTVALTFDDVPDSYFTTKILDVLKQYNVRATFFLVGYRAANHPEIVKRMVREGHVLGNHSYNHRLLTKLSMDSYKKQILQTDRIIKRIAGYKPRFIRPPYGEINEQQLRWAGAKGYTIVNWDVDSQDWRGISSKKVASNILTTVSPGSIVLQHAGGNIGGNLDGTLEALPEIIKKLKKQKYKFVTIAEMFHMPKNK